MVNYVLILYLCIEFILGHYYRDPYLLLRKSEHFYIDLDKSIPNNVIAEESIMSRKLYF